MMTGEDYVRAGGAFCPACEGNDVQAGDSTFDLGMAYQNCVCLSCSAQWVDVYTLAGFSNLETAPQ